MRFLTVILYALKVYRMDRKHVRFQGFSYMQTGNGLLQKGVSCRPVRVQRNGLIFSKGKGSSKRVMNDRNAMWMARIYRNPENFRIEDFEHHSTHQSGRVISMWRCLQESMI